MNGKPVGRMLARCALLAALTAFAQAGRADSRDALFGDDDDAPGTATKVSGGGTPNKAPSFKAPVWAQNDWKPGNGLEVVVASLGQ